MFSSQYKRKLDGSPVLRSLVQIAAYILGEFCIETVYRRVAGAVWRLLGTSTNVFVDAWVGELCFFAAAVTIILIMSRYFPPPTTPVCRKLGTFNTWRNVSKAVASLAVGLIIGFILQAVHYRLLVYFQYGIPFVADSRPAFPFFNNAIYCLLIAIVEETAYRAYLLPLIESTWGTGIAVLVTSVLFALAHLTNPDALANFSNAFDTLIRTFSTGILFAFCLVLTRKLWLPIALHFSWNFFTGMAFGDPGIGVLPIGNLYFAPDKIDQFAFGLNCICSVGLLLLIIRCGQWKRRPKNSTQSNQLSSSLAP